MRRINEFIKWTPLSPFEIYLRHHTMYECGVIAVGVYFFLGKEGKAEEISTLLKKLLSKTSITKTCEILVQLSEKLGLTTSLLDCCTQEKFSGLLGITQVVNMVLSPVCFHSGILKSPFGGRITLDYNRRVKLGLMLEEHNELQKKIDELNSFDDKEEIQTSIERISAYSRERTYPLFDLIEEGEKIKKILNLISNPVELGLHWTGIINPETKKDIDFYPMARDKEDGGYFQYLCIVLFSLKF